jgi:hypothetical protein
MSPHPKKKPKTQWWTCARCGTRNDPDHHPRSCRGCGTERPENATGRKKATAAERSSAARIGAHASWAATPDRARRTAPARRGFMRRFEDQVDPERKLPPHERQRRAESAMRAYMGQLSKRGKKARARGRDAA